jgi:hypothetical protein
MIEVTEREFWFVIGPPPHTTKSWLDSFMDRKTVYLSPSGAELGFVLQRNDAPAAVFKYFLVENVK